MRLQSIVGIGTAAVIGVAVSVLAVSPARADTTTPGGYNVVAPSRILDTRSGIGAPKVKVPAGGTLTFVADAGIDTPVSAVALNVTAVVPQTLGYLTVWAAGTTRPLASTLNFQAAQTVPNLVVTPVGAGGKVSVFNGSKGSVDVLADIEGYFVGGEVTQPNRYQAENPVRVLDTRRALGVATSGQVAPNSVTKVQFAGRNGIPADATSVVVNLTASNSRGRGYLTAYPDSQGRPTASNLNFEPRQDRANLALIALDTDGTLSLFNGSLYPVDLVADVSGYFLGGDADSDTFAGIFASGAPIRILDTRVPGNTVGALPGLSTSKISVCQTDTGEEDSACDLFKAVELNVTATNSQEQGYLTTWDGTGNLPSTSNSNFVPRANVAGTVIVPLNPDGTVSIYNGSFGNVDVVVDLTGVFLADEAQPDAAQRSHATPKAGGHLTHADIDKALARLRAIHARVATTPLSVTTK